MGSIKKRRSDGVLRFGGSGKESNLPGGTSPTTILKTARATGPHPPPHNNSNLNSGFKYPALFFKIITEMRSYPQNGQFFQLPREICKVPGFQRFPR